MQKDFHYYATYCAAYLAGYSHEESLAIGYSAQFVDCCSRSLLTKLNGPVAAATTQLQLEMMDAKLDPVGLQNVTRIWASFHFLPGDLYAEKKRVSRLYRNKYRLICKPNGVLVKDTVELAKGRSLQAVGIAMHVLADTWAHQKFAGTPSLVINNTDSHFFELMEDGTRRKITFRHNPSAEDNLEKSIYTNSLYQARENSVMNLGHGRAGHLPDYSFIRYAYLPAWADYEEMVKDNPSDYYYAFSQMVYAMKYLRNMHPDFETGRYDEDAVSPWESEIQKILLKRQLDSCEDWKAFGEKLSGQEIPEFDLNRYQQEYQSAERDSKDGTFLGRFFLAALAQKSMVTNKIFKSRNLLAGFSVDYLEEGFKGIRDFRKLVELAERGRKHD
ncbi:MAG: DUF6765 family protein [Oscillospiraceae bacterium]